MSKAKTCSCRGCNKHTVVSRSLDETRPEQKTRMPRSHSRCFSYGAGQHLNSEITGKKNTKPTELINSVLMATAGRKCSLAETVNLVLNEINKNKSSPLSFEPPGLTFTQFLACCLHPLSPVSGKVAAAPEQLSSAMRNQGTRCHFSSKRFRYPTSTSSVLKILMLVILPL